MQDPTTSTIPTETFANIRAWLADLQLESKKVVASSTTSPVAVTATRMGDKFMEEPMQFGRKGHRLAAYAPARVLLLDRADQHFNATTTRQSYYDLAVSMIKAAIAEHATNKPQVADTQPRATGRICEHKSGEHAVQ